MKEIAINWYFINTDYYHLIDWYENILILICENSINNNDNNVIIITEWVNSTSSVWCRGANICGPVYPSWYTIWYVSPGISIRNKCAQRWRPISIGLLTGNAISSVLILVMNCLLAVISSLQNMLLISFCLCRYSVKQSSRLRCFVDYFFFIEFNCYTGAFSTVSLFIYF